MDFFGDVSLQSVPDALGLLIPITLASAALIGGRTAFGPARFAAGLSAALAVAFAGSIVFLPESAASFVRADGLSATMLLLVSGLGVVIVSYSRTYLDRDPRQRHYARWLLLTLASVSTLVSTGHLVVLAAAWTLTSLSLHQLLTFFRDRTQALVAAHKKFLVSRLADLCLWSALALTAHQTGTLSIDGVILWAEAQTELSGLMELAAVLLVVAAALKSAQLPFHGWLTQVMEAPTPVSALLHAGIVNLGGFLMIRLAPVLALAPVAQTLLVVIGTCTVVMAALIARTRVSIKVGLAWSTCAQMGFMLVECGLGLWSLALLHLVAHSFYKAHAFLSAGGTVDAWRLDSLTQREQATPLRWAFATLLMSAIAIAVSLWAGLSEGSLVLALVVSWSAVPWLAKGTLTPSSVASAAIVPVLYAGLHAAAFQFWPAPEMQGVWFAPLAVLVGFGLLHAIETAVELRPDGAFALRLHSWLFAGFYLDERFTRLTFRLWPPHLPKAPRHARSLSTAVEAL